MNNCGNCGKEIGGRTDHFCQEDDSSARPVSYVPAIERGPADTAHTEMSRLLDLSAEQGREIERLRSELENIRDANWRDWYEEVRSAEDFVHWAKSRARNALLTHNAECSGPKGPAGTPG